MLILTVVVTVIITFLLSFIFLKYIPEKSQDLKINKYKKGLYTSTLCQYGCPLTLQQFQNKTKYLPEQSCAKNCVDEFKSIQLISDDISNNEVKKDNLINDMASAINNCKSKAADMNTRTLNNTLFFSCSVGDLTALKDKYSYLR